MWSIYCLFIARINKLVDAYIFFYYKSRWTKSGVLFVRRVVKKSFTFVGSTEGEDKKERWRTKWGFSLKDFAARWRQKVHRNQIINKKHHPHIDTTRPLNLFAPVGLLINSYCLHAGCIWKSESYSFFTMRTETSFTQVQNLFCTLHILSFDTYTSTMFEMLEDDVVGFSNRCICPHFGFILCRFILSFYPLKVMHVESLFTRPQFCQIFRGKESHGVKSR